MGSAISAASTDLICFGDVRWGFVFHRPQHLMTRFARSRRVFFIEEPVSVAGESSADVTAVDGVHLVVPRLTSEASPGQVMASLHELVGSLIARFGIEHPIAWLYSAAALPLLRGVPTSALVYDRANGVRRLASATARVRGDEEILLNRADLVFADNDSFDQMRARVEAVVASAPRRAFAALAARNDRRPALAG